MEKCIGIRREDKNQWERRAPLTPQHINRLVKQGFSVIVQPSTIRVFTNQQYAQAGAQIREDLSDCKVVFAIKEIPAHLFLPDRTYMFFTHMIKGQPHNMPLLKRVMEQRSTIIDYEKVTDEADKRLIFFGRFAGHAGMIDSLWSLGKRLDHEGIANPFSSLRQAYTYRDLDEAREAVKQVAQHITAHGIPPQIAPMVVGFAGYGNVSKGAQEIFDLLPFVEVAPDVLTEATARHAHTVHTLIKVVFKEEHTVRHTDASKSFDLKEYMTQPQRYETIFPRYIPHLTMLINAIFWAPGQPRLVSIDNVRDLYLKGDAAPKLKVIGDISCDIRGGVECTITGTDIGNPVFVYDPEHDKALFGFEGRGPVIMAVDNLPCELPVESSTAFGDALINHIPAIVDAHYDRSFDDLDVPQFVKKAVLVFRGALTPRFLYLKDAMDKVLGAHI